MLTTAWGKTHFWYNDTLFYVESDGYASFMSYQAYEFHVELALYRYYIIQKLHKFNNVLLQFSSRGTYYFWMTLVVRTAPYNNSLLHIKQAQHESFLMSFISSTGSPMKKSNVWRWFRRMFPGKIGNASKNQLQRTWMRFPKLDSYCGIACMHVGQLGIPGTWCKEVVDRALVHSDEMI